MPNNVPENKIITAEIPFIQPSIDSIKTITF
jgi:hypothetical protein